MTRPQDHECQYAIAGPQTLDRIARLQQDNDEPGVQRAFARVCQVGASANGGSSGSLRDDYSFEVVGDKTVLRCPPVTVGTGADARVGYAVPQDCTPIGYRDYLQMKSEMHPDAPKTVRRFGFTC